MTKDRDYLERNDMEVIRIPAKSDLKSRTTNRPMKQKDVDWNDAEQVKQVRVRQRPRRPTRRRQRRQPTRTRSQPW